jgi:hypothetical protein
MSWRFKGSTPLWFKLVAGLLLADTALHLGLALTVSSWASPVRDAAHMHPVPFRNGVIYFAPAGIGWYVSAWWIGVGLFVVMLGLLFANRDQLYRTS